MSTENQLLSRQMELISSKLGRYKAAVKAMVMACLETLAEIQRTDIHSFMDRCEQLYKFRMVFKDQGLKVADGEFLIEELFGWSRTTYWQNCRVYETFQDVPPDILQRIPKTILRKSANDHDLAIKLIKEATKLRGDETLSIQTCNHLVEGIAKIDEQPPEPTPEPTLIESPTATAPVEEYVQDDEPEEQDFVEDEVETEQEPEMTDDEPTHTIEDVDDPEPIDAAAIKTIIVDEAERRFRFFTTVLDLGEYPSFKVARSDKQKVSDLVIKILTVIHGCSVEES